MNVKSTPLLPLFADFIKKYPKYASRSRNGKPISVSIVQTYLSVFKNLEGLQVHMGKELIIPVIAGRSVREIKRVNHAWDVLYKSLLKYLQSKGHLDNYVGLQIKILRTFCTWIVKEKNMNLGNYKDYLHITKEETPIISLSMEHIGKLLDANFLIDLPTHLSKTARLLLFGCCVGLRYSDLESLTYRNIEKRDGVVYLVQKSKKTGTPTRIKLPDFALEILSDFKFCKPRLLPYPSKNQFNKNLKALGAAAGWTDEVGKPRTRAGKRIELRTTNGRKYRFCDLLSSHVMRKTAITTLLMNGMPEHMVRRISGHAANSSEFFRYVQYSQSFVDEQTEMVFSKITNYTATSEGD